MSVRECPECQGTVAGSRSECPHCGKSCPPPAQKRVTVRGVVLASCYISLAYSVGSLLGASVEGYLLGVAVGSGAAIWVHPWG